MAKLINTVCCVVFLFAQASYAQSTYDGEYENSNAAFAEWSGFTHPESVHFSSEFLYVSEMGAQTRGAERDGHLRRFNLDGTVDYSFVVTDALTSPMGMAVVRDSIWVADVDRIVAFSEQDGHKTAEVSLAHHGATFLNDIVRVSDRQLLVSDSSLKVLIGVDVSTGESWVVNINMMGTSPNGLAYDEASGLVYIAANKAHALGEPGNGVVIKSLLDESRRWATTMTYTQIGRFLDGIALWGSAVLLSDWNGFNNDGVLYSLLSTDLRYIGGRAMGVSGFADFSISSDGRFLAAPDLTAGKVRIFQLY